MLDILFTLVAILPLAFDQFIGINDTPPLDYSNVVNRPFEQWSNLLNDL